MLQILKAWWNKQASKHEIDFDMKFEEKLPKELVKRVKNVKKAKSKKTKVRTSTAGSKARQARKKGRI